MNTPDLVALAKEMTHPGPGTKVDAARRAFLLAHRARRLLENAAEQASRSRWTALESPGRESRADIERYAQTVASSVIQYPVRGEAKVYAAMLDAVDRATSVAGTLYRAWLDSIPERAEALRAPEYAQYQEAANG